MNNGYTSIEINGEKIGLKFGMACILDMQEKQIPDTSGAPGSSLAFIGYAAELLFAAYKNNCLLKREAPALTFEPFYEFVEDAYLDESKMKSIADVINVFTESKFVKSQQEDPQPGDTKKKSGQGTKLKPSVTAS